MPTSDGNQQSKSTDNQQILEVLQDILSQLCILNSQMTHITDEEIDGD